MPLRLEGSAGQLNVCVLEFHRPTQSALTGAKTMTPLGALAAPANKPLMPLRLDGSAAQLNVCVLKSHRPMQLEKSGTKTMTPLGVLAAPSN